MTVDDEGKLGIVVVSAVDWTMWEEQHSMNDIYKSEPLTAIVVGLLVREDDDYIWLAQQVFDDESNSCRKIVCIPKVCIEDRHDLRMDGETKKAPRKRKRSKK